MSLIRKHGAVLQAWACLDLVSTYSNESLTRCCLPDIILQGHHRGILQSIDNVKKKRWTIRRSCGRDRFEPARFIDQLKSCLLRHFDELNKIVDDFELLTATGAHMCRSSYLYDLE